MKKLILSLVLLAWISPLGIKAQQNPVSWDRIRWLTGNWIGEGKGEPGSSEGSFTFRFDLDQNILVRNSHSEYPATADRPAMKHDDFMVVYSNGSGIPDRAMYWDNEGHVIEYVLNTTDSSAVFQSAKLGNGPVFRLSYIRLAEDRANVRFEMSRDGKSFLTYVEGKCRRSNHK
jgi:hypothetical protein